MPAPGIRTVIAEAGKVLREAASVAAKSWAACLRRVFEVDPLLCTSCRAVMVPVAIILEDQEIERLLSHLGLARGISHM